jgi:hypothetical protein
MPRKPKKQQDKNQKDEKETTLPPAFKWVFVTVTSITILCLVGFIVLAFRYPEVDQASRLNSVFETLQSTFTLGFGAIVGLLGGKAL